jgi:hypothetical protein
MPGTTLIRRTIFASGSSCGEGIATE